VVNRAVNRAMVFTMIKNDVYKLLCEGFTQSKIASLLHISRVYVSKITNKLIKENYVFCVNPKGNPKLYKPTDKPLPLCKPSVNHFSGGLNTLPTGVCRVHNIAMSYLLFNGSKIPIKWDKEWTIRNARLFQLRQVFDVGMVTIRLVVSKNKPDRIIIWMPERYLSNEQLDDHIRILESYCQKVANWFMKTYHCQLGLPEPYSKMHFAFPEDPDFVHIAKKTNISKGDHTWVDDSDGHAEWETDDIRLAKIKIDMPNRVLQLENTVEKLAGSVEKLVKIFDTPSRPDNFRDVV